MRKIIFTVVMLSVFIGTAAVYGSYNLGEVNVEAEEYTYGINEFGKAAAVFNSGSFDAGASANAADILDEVPGFDFLNSSLLDFGAGAYAGSVTKIRGIGGGINSGILTLVDDRPQSMAVFRHALFDTLALDNADYIEVIKGPSSVEYGNMAKNGIINIRTKIPYQEGMKTKIKAVLGSFLTQNYFFNNMMKSGKYDYSVSSGYKSTSGFRPNSESSQQSYSLKTGYSYGNNIRYSANASYNDVVYYNPGPADANWDREQEGCNTKVLSWDIRAENISADFKGKLIFYSDSGSNNFMKSVVPGSITQADPKGVTMPGTDITFSNYGVRFMEEWNLIPGNVIKIGFDWQNFGGTFENYPYNTAMKKNEKRYESDYAPYFVFAQKVGIGGIMLGLRYAYNDRWGHELIPQAGFTLSLYDNNKIYFNVSKGYATPAMGTVIFSSEDLLKPEDYWQYEAGVEQKFGKTFSLLLTAYQTEGQNTLKADPVIPGKFTNTGFTLVRGVEADFALNIGDFMKLGASGAYCEPGEKSANVSLLTANPYMSFLLMKIFNLKIGAEFAKNRYDADKKLQKLADYMVLNASADCKTDFISKGSVVFVEAGNILNTDYEIKKGYPAPGFIIKGGMVLKL